MVEISSAAVLHRTSPAGNTEVKPSTAFKAGPPGSPVPRVAPHRGGPRPSVLGEAGAAAGPIQGLGFDYMLPA